MLKRRDPKDSEKVDEMDKHVEFQVENDDEEQKGEEDGNQDADEKNIDKEGVQNDNELNLEGRHE